MSQKNDLTIQQKISKLDEMLAWFDGDDFVLEEAPTRFHEAEKLADEINHALTQLQNEVTVLREKFDKD